MRILLTVNRFHRFLMIKLNRTQIFADQPAMQAIPPTKQNEADWGTSGQVYTDNIVILQFKNLDNLCSPARLCLAWQAGLCPKKEIPIL
jgi:hypothetical protein